MHFSAPTTAWFLAVAAAPVIIYLVFRRRRRDVPWGAIYILRRTLEKQSRISVWKQYVIVAVRTLAFAALPLAFMGPFLAWRAPENSRFPRAPSATHRTVLLDNSGSMQAGFGSGSCLDAAQSLCRAMLAAGTFPGRIDILPMAGSQESPGVSSADLPLKGVAIEQAIGALGPRPGPIRLEPALREAATRFRGSHYRRKELFILSDFSARDFAEARVAEGLFQSLGKLGVKVYCRSYANREANNFAVLDFTPHMDVLLQGQPTVFYVRLGYYGTREAADTWLTISDTDGGALFEDTVSLAQGEKTIEIPLALPAGEHVLTVSVSDDDLPADNSLRRSFDVRPELRLMVVQDINLQSGFENPREWLQQALVSDSGKKNLANELLGRKIRGNVRIAHEEERSQGPARFRFQVDFVNSAQVNPDIFRDSDGVVLLDVDTLAPEAVEGVRLYAARGGTVLLAPGPQVDPARFNTSLAPLLPATLGKPLREEIDPEQYEHAVLETGGDRLLRELEDPRHGNIGSSRFYNHYTFAPRSLHAEAEVLFSLSDGAPLLLRRPVGRGTVLLWTAGLGMAWQSMVVHPVFPVFFGRLFNAAAAQRGFPRNLEPGQPIIHPVEVDGALIVTPTGQRVPAPTSQVDGTLYVRCDATNTPGEYRVRPDPDDPTAEHVFTVRSPMLESDYRPLAGTGRTTFEKTADAELLASEQDLIEAVGRDYPGRDLAVYAAAALFGLLVLDAGLCRGWFA